MGLPSINFARTKVLVHAFQAFVIFIAWAMTIAVFTRNGSTDGRTGWYFGMCWLSIPGLIYLVGVPMWPRARRFGNVYAFAFMDVLFAILWFSAWIAVATYVAAGKADGANDDKLKDKSGCDRFGYGSPGKCKLSIGTVILGVIIFLLFGLTSWFSFRNVVHYRRTGTMPDAPSDPTFAAHTQAAFSSNPAQDFEEEEDNSEYRTGRPGDRLDSSTHDGDDEYALLHQNEVDDHNHGGDAYDPTSHNAPVHPIPPAGSMLHDYDTSYTGAYGSATRPYPQTPDDYSHQYGR